MQNVIKFNVPSSGSSMENRLLKHLLNAGYFCQTDLLLQECVDASEIGDKRAKTFLIKIEHPAGSKSIFVKYRAR